MAAKNKNQCFRSVVVGEEMIGEFMMFSLGVPLSRKSLEKYFTILKTRMGLILQVLLQKKIHLLTFPNINFFPYIN
jgi:hypothetical protein